MSDFAARVRHDKDHREGTIAALDDHYRAYVHWDACHGEPEWQWVPRRHLIILARYEQQVSTATDRRRRRR
jgi:hypothetical protein